jgi:hypothetical protein
MGGATLVAAAAASSRPLFFPAAFDDLDGDGFILQEQSVFTRIRSGATLKDLGGGALGSTTAAACVGVDLPQMEAKWLQLEWVKKTLRVLASIYKSNWLHNGRMAKSMRS